MKSAGSWPGNGPGASLSPASSRKVKGGSSIGNLASRPGIALLDEDDLIGRRLRTRRDGAEVHLHVEDHDAVRSPRSDLLPELLTLHAGRSGRDRVEVSGELPDELRVPPGLC